MSLNITLVGGHTEVTYELTRPLAIGAMLGEVEKDKPVFTAGAKPGDSIILTKGIAIEGTAILAREAYHDLKLAGITPHVLKKAKGFLFSPGISVVQDSSIICAVSEVHSMHDPTEGGLATGLLEIARASGVGIVINMNAIPILPESHKICEVLNIDPLGLIASGALLSSVPKQDVPKLISALNEAGIDAYEIGYVTNPDRGLKLRTMEGIQDLPTFERDELARFFGR